MCEYERQQREPNRKHTTQNQMFNRQKVPSPGSELIKDHPSHFWF